MNVKGDVMEENGHGMEGCMDEVELTTLNEGTTKYVTLDSAKESLQRLADVGNEVATRNFMIGALFGLIVGLVLMYLVLS